MVGSRSEAPGRLEYGMEYQHEGMVGYYLKKLNEDWYYDDLKNIVKQNRLANWVVKNIWTSSHERKEMFKGTYPVIFSYVEIAFLLLKSIHR